MLKVIGAGMVILCCGWIGFSMASQHRREEKILETFIAALDYIGCELQYHLTPLQELCMQTAKHSKGVISVFFTKLSEELESQIYADASICTENVVSSLPSIPESVREYVLMMGNTLGQFGLDGQLQGLDAVRTSCRDRLLELRDNKEERIKSYQTLSICAGAALVILFV